MSQEWATRPWDPKPFTEDPCGFTGTPNIHVTMLRWACSVRDIPVHEFRTTAGRRRWAAYGATTAVTFRMNMPSLTSPATRAVTHHKQQTKAVLADHGVPVPDGIEVAADDTATALAWWDRLHGAAAVVKPITGSGGKGVTTAIADADGLLRAMRAAGNPRVVLEQHLAGADHRLLVVGGRTIAGIRRHPASVMGDGVSTIRALVEQKNVARKSNPYAGTKAVAITDDVSAYLRVAGLTADSVPEHGRRVRLRGAANISLGGDSEDITDLVHPDFAALAARSWGCFPDLAFCGVDLIAEDIRRPAAGQRHAVIEINANCDLAMHHFPTIPGGGPPVDAAGAIIDHVFPTQPAPERRAMALRVYGTVKNVGYLTWLRKRVALLGVRGYAAGLPDGSLEVFAEGTRSALDELRRMCARGSAKSVVTRLTYQDCDAEGSTGFTVRR